MSIEYRVSDGPTRQGRALNPKMSHDRMAIPRLKLQMSPSPVKDKWDRSFSSCTSASFFWKENSHRSTKAMIAREGEALLRQGTCETVTSDDLRVNSVEATKEVRLHLRPGVKL